jgi:hypothetical protein
MAPPLEAMALALGRLWGVEAAGAGVSGEFEGVVNELRSKKLVSTP